MSAWAEQEASGLPSVDVVANPYRDALNGGAHALDGGGTIHIVDVTGRVPPVTCDVRQWMAEPTPSDRSILDLVDGPILDVGCGPGRMLQAARDRALEAVGVDLNPEAAGLARSRGDRVLEQSVFAPIAGRWNGFLLIDGNIGIGGDPLQLLRRLRRLAHRGARLLVETDRQEHLEEHYQAVLCDEGGRCGEQFAWSRVGAHPLRRLARAADWTPVSEHRIDERTISVLSAS
ncbi:class I SAM-dependent methyltransferase [Tersicoccus sp. MR15.9]|uniref:class I SAM-dependent methyltransferase n=1 Tax=Tersicoccus mangrovi TaxID=3121635 RepID=UPI002FE58676